MSIEPGTYELGPEHGTLSVRTGKSGAASKAGHNLLIRVDRWGATVDLATDAEGTGGVSSLDDEDKQGIAQTINQEVLKGTPITFRSTAVRPDGDGRFRVTGDLELLGGVNLIAFDIEIGDDHHLTGTATVKQTDWGMKPYSALFGTLKVTDEVQVSVDGRLQPAA
jgi:polyisoprenoid-binding protein YceI